MADKAQFTVVLGRTGGAQAEVPSLVFQTLFLTAALYLPLSGARVGIRAAKQAELDRIAAELGHHDNVLGEADGPDRVVRLMAYRERIQEVSEWPFGVGTAPRALLYVALPLLSWIAAAMVERSLDVVPSSPSSRRVTCRRALMGEARRAWRVS